MENNPQETLLTVGKIYPEWQTKQDGFRLEWGDAGFTLCAMLNGISAEEIDGALYGYRGRMLLYFHVWRYAVG